MWLRDKFRQYPLLSTGVTMTVLLAALIVLGWSRLPAWRSTEVRSYYYDLSTGELFAESKRRIPPFPTPSGDGEAVLAMVYACGDGGCDDPARREIGYLLKYTPEIKAALEAEGDSADPAVRAALAERGAWISPPPTRGGLRWIPMNSNAGMALLDAIPTLCAPEVMEYCTP